MKASFITAAALFGSLAYAQPHHSNKRHGHGALRHEKRDIVWVTETDIVTETVDITSTVWVDADATSAPVVATSTPVTTTSDAKFYTATPEPVKSATTLSSVYVAPPAPTTSAYVAPPAPVAPSSSTPVYVAPVAAPTTEVVAPPAPTTTTPAVVVAPATSAAPVPAPTTSSSQQSSSSGYSGTCSSGSKCSGDITFYDTGLGACGWDNDGTKENVVALPAGLMGAQSNGNPFCGMTITISKGGKTTTAKVVDKCPGCSGSAIDLSHKAFQDLADEGVGRTEATWWFN